MENITSTREKHLVWRFDQVKNAPLHEVSSAYYAADDLMRDEGFYPVHTRFQTNEDGSFTLWETYK